MTVEYCLGGDSVLAQLSRLSSTAEDIVSTAEESDIISTAGGYFQNCQDCLVLRRETISTEEGYRQHCRGINYHYCQGCHVLRRVIISAAKGVCFVIQKTI